MTPTPTTTTETATSPDRPRNRRRPQIDTGTETIHGRRISYRRAGYGEGVLLIHGITNRASSWDPVIRQLAGDYELIAPDLPGHGDSQRQRGDHSLGAHASVLRDLLGVLGWERGTVVGHSLGGGIAMQFAYQFPEYVERLVLVDSGGLGREVSPLLRSAALPGAEKVISLLASETVTNAGTAFGNTLGRIGLQLGADLAEVSAGIASLGDAERRAAFVRTVRSVISPLGQRINATDRLYLAQDIPTLIVWGERDPLIPVAHAYAAHEATPGSRLEVMEGCGHFPHLDDPDGFSDIFDDFMETTEPGVYDVDRMRQRLREGASHAGG
jgi:pimeloyl-ACP methyl ester carboxylesterase